MVNVALTPGWRPMPTSTSTTRIGKIPALSVKGMDLFDSPVICEYLDSQHKRRKLLPRQGPGEAGWVALRLQAMGDGLLDAAACLARYGGLPQGPRGQSAGPTGTKGPGQEDRRRARTSSRPRPSLSKGKPTLGTITVGVAALGLSRLPLLAIHNWRAKAAQARPKWFTNLLQACRR